MNSSREAIDFAGFPDAENAAPPGNRSCASPEPKTSTATQRANPEITNRKESKPERQGTTIAVILIGIAIIFIILSQSKTNTGPSSNRPSVAQQIRPPPVTRQPTQTTEALPTGPSRLLEEPPARTGATLGRTQLRWCMFWDARIDFLADMIVDEPLFNPFNAALSDLNNRCSNSRYDQRDMTVVRQELERHRSQLKSEADALYRTWAKSHLVPATLEVQRHLKAIGYDPGPVDGLIGPKTREAIRQLERDAGVEPTGIISNELIDFLARAAAKQT